MGLNPDIRRRHDAMREAAALLSDGWATVPPLEVRRRLLRDATSRGRVNDITPSSPLEVYENQIADMRSLLDSLEPADWKLVAAPYVWSVHALVAHLLVIERYSKRQMGLRPDFDYGDNEHHLALGKDEILAELERSPQMTADDWHEQALSTVADLRSLEVDPTTPVTFHGWPFSVASVLIARGFEIWTHADDIRRATGRPLGSPSPADLRAMSTFSVASLPLLLPVVAPAVEAARTRIVLTGLGGGTFRIGPLVEGAEDEPVLTMAVDVVDYCRLASRRIDTAELDLTVEGDGELATAFLAAARVFAV